LIKERVNVQLRQVNRG